MKVLTHLNLNKNELQNAIFQNLATAPSTPFTGQFYYDTVEHILKIYNGSSWTTAGSSYILPAASTTVLGGVKIDGTTVTIDENNVISAMSVSGDTLPLGTLVEYDGATVPAGWEAAVDKTNGGITVSHETDYSMVFATSWVPVKYLFDFLKANSNTNMFQLYNGGVKILIAGYYTISFSVNLNTSGAIYSAVLNVNDVNLVVNDYRFSPGMSNISLSPYTMYLNVNDVVYGYIRSETAANYNTRGARSQMTIIKV
jgi:hypothetical protein